MTGQNRSQPRLLLGGASSNIFYCAPARWLLSGPKCVLVITEDGKVCALEERDLATKLESLFRKNLYPTAISLARSQCFDSDPTVLRVPPRSSRAPTHRPAHW